MTAQTLRRKFLNSEACVQSLNSLCEVCGRRSGNVANYVLSADIQFHSVSQLAAGTACLTVEATSMTFQL
jgi:hypothetical protein